MTHKEKRSFVIVNDLLTIRNKNQLAIYITYNPQKSPPNKEKLVAEKKARRMTQSLRAHVSSLYIIYSYI